MALTLKTGNHAYSNWGDVKIKLSIENISGYFVGEIPNIFKNMSIKDLDIGMGDSFSVEMNGNKLITGYIEKIIPNSIIEDDGSASSSVIIGGRDKTADLMCSFGETVNEFKKLSILAIIRKLVAPFDIDIKIEEAVSSQLQTKLETFKIDEGESPLEAISALCRIAGVLPVSYGDGKLTLTKSTSQYGTIDSITFGQNAKQVTLYSDDTERYSKYTVKGIGISADTKEIKDYTSPWGQTVDAVVKRNKPLTVFSEMISDSANCVNKSKWIARIRAGNSRKIVYRLFGWTQSDGRAWYPNTQVVVNDSFLRFKDTMLISSVEYFNSIVDDRIDTYADITVVDKTTYDISQTSKIWSVFDRA